MIDQVHQKEASSFDQSLETKADDGNVTTYSPPPFSLKANSLSSIQAEQQTAQQRPAPAPTPSGSHSAQPVQMMQEGEEEELIEISETEDHQPAFADAGEDPDDENNPSTNPGSGGGNGNGPGAAIPLQTKPISSNSNAPIQRSEAGEEERDGWLFEKLSGWASEINGYDLLCVVIGQDPITNESVEQTPSNLIREFMVMIGQEERYNQIQQAGGIQSAFVWVQSELQARNLTWERVSSDFATIWDQVSVWEPVASYERIMGPLGQLIDDVLGFAGVVGQKAMEFVFEGIMGAGGGQVMEMLQRAGAAFSMILEDPVGFFSNLTTAIGNGVQAFGANIGTHLVNGLLEWVTGAVGGAGISLPETWDLRGIIGFVMEVLGLTWANLRIKLVERVGEENVARAETTVDAVQRLVTEGPLGLWEYVQDQASAIKNQVMEGIKEMVITRVVQAGVAHLVSMFTPVGALIQAVRSIYTSVTFLIDNLQRVSAFVNSILDSLSNIAAGVLGPAAQYIESALAGAIPMALDFMLRLLGLGNMGNNIQNSIENAREPIDNAVDTGLDWVEGKVRSLTGRGQDSGPEEKQAEGSAPQQEKQIGDGEIGETIHFDAEGHPHRLWFEERGDNVELMVASTPIALGTKLNDWRTILTQKEAEHRGSNSMAEQLQTMRSRLAEGIQLAQIADQKGEKTLTHKEKLDDWLSDHQQNNPQERAIVEQNLEQKDNETEQAQRNLVEVLEELFILFEDEGNSNDRMPDNYMPTVPNFARHHIIPHAWGPSGEHPVRIIKDLGINLNNPGNMIYLPTGNDPAESSGRSTHPDMRNTHATGQSTHIAFHPNYNQVVKSWLNDLERLADLHDWDDDRTKSLISNLQNRIRQRLEGGNVSQVNNLTRNDLPSLSSN